MIHGQENLERIAKDLSVSTSRLSEVLAENKVKFVPTEKTYAFLTAQKEQLLHANIDELKSLGLSGRTAHSLFRILAKYTSGSGVPKSLYDFKGNISLSEAETLPPVGKNSIHETRLLFDHIGFEYLD